MKTFEDLRKAIDRFQGHEREEFVTELWHTLQSYQAKIELVNDLSIFADLTPSLKQAIDEHERIGLFLKSVVNSNRKGDKDERQQHD